MKRIIRTLLLGAIVFTQILITTSCSTEKTKSLEEQIEEIIPDQTVTIDSTAIKRQEKISFQRDLYSNLIDLNNLNQYFETLSIEKLDQEKEIEQEEYEDYEYDVYDQDEIILGGYRFGMFKGTMYAFIYGEHEHEFGIKRSVLKYLSQNQVVEDSSTIHLFQSLSGLLPYSDNDSTLPFSYVNVRFIEWAAENIIPSPNQYLHEYSYQQLYNGILKGFFRKLVLSHIYLERVYDFEKSSKLYLDQINKDPTGCIDFLYEKFGKLELIDSNKDDLANSYNDHVFIGFWLRRQMDGSKQKLKEILDKFMTEFDNDWYTASLDKEVGYLSLSKSLYIGKPNNDCNIEIGKYYQILDRKIFLFDNPTQFEIPKEYVYTYDKAIVVQVDSIHRAERNDGTQVNWVNGIIKNHSKWLLCDHLDTEIKNFQYFDSLRLEGGFDTTGNKMYFKLILVNNTKYEIEIPGGVLQRTTSIKSPRITSGGNVMKLERMTLPAGAEIALIDDEIIMGGYNSTDVWYAPKSNPMDRIVSFIKDRDRKRIKGIYNLKYTLQFVYNTNFKTHPLNLTLDLDIAEKFIKEKYKQR